MRTRVIVSAIIEKRGKLLLGRKPKNVGPYPNTWHLIGGGVKEGGESLINAIKREVREEAGISLVNIIPLSFAEDTTLDRHRKRIHYYFHYFRASPKPGHKLRPGDDIAELRWFSRKEIRKIPLPKASRNRFRAMGWL